MTKAKKATIRIVDELRRTKANKTLKTLREWADHLGLRLRRRDHGYSICSKYGSSRACDRADFRKLNQIEPWLNKWMDGELARLERPAR
jgi:hypothetical protein